MNVCVGVTLKADLQYVNEIEFILFVTFGPKTVFVGAKSIEIVDYLIGRSVLLV